MTVRRSRAFAAGLRIVPIAAAAASPRPSPASAAPPRPRLSTAASGARSPPTVRPIPGPAIRTDRYKLILSIQPKDEAELYDPRNDPREMRNLAADPAHKDVIADLKRRLLTTMKELEDPAIPAVEGAL